MHAIDDETIKEVLGEALLDQLKAIREYVEDVPAIKKDIATLKEDVAELKSDMKIVKSVVTHQSKDINRHDKILKAFKPKTA